MILDAIISLNKQGILKKAFIVLLLSSFLISCTPSYEDLTVAIETSNVELLREYVEKNIDLNDNSEGPYPLLLALDKPDIEICKFLIENGADVNIKNKKGKTPLFIAYQNGNLDLIKPLIENGADVNIFVGERSDEKLLIFDAIESGDEELAKVVLSGNQNLNVVANKNRGIAFKAVAYSSVDFFKYIIDLGVPIDLLDAAGESPLVLALDRGFIDKAMILIDSGAEIENFRFTWSMLVEHWNDGASEIAEIYLEKKIPIDSETDDPILTCVLHANADAMKWFLEHGFSPTRKNQHGETPIDFVWRIGFDFEDHTQDDPEAAKIRDRMYSMLKQYGAVEKDPSWF